MCTVNTCRWIDLNKEQLMTYDNRSISAQYKHITQLVVSVTLRAPGAPGKFVSAPATWQGVMIVRVTVSSVTWRSVRVWAISEPTRAWTSPLQCVSVCVCVSVCAWKNWSNNYCPRNTDRIQAVGMVYICNNTTFVFVLTIVKIIFYPIMISLRDMRPEIVARQLSSAKLYSQRFGREIRLGEDGGSASNTIFPKD